jgi:transposase
MLYLSTDLHSKQLTVNLRDEEGEVMMRRQVSTRGEEPRQFLEDVARRAGDDGYVAIVEVCGFHEWFTELLPQCGCREVVLIQAEQQSRRKTDRRDADQLGEVLWVNRQRLLAGRKVKGVRRVVPPTPQERDDRRLTQLRRGNGAERTRVINGVKHILRRLNVGQRCPTKGIQTKAARQWLRTFPLPELDRLEMNLLLARWELLEKQGEQLDEQIARRALADPQATLLRTVPGIGFFTSLALSSRIGNIGRFATPRSLANYWGLTPSCKNSGESQRRLGSITKAGSALARFMLGQLVLQVLKKDATMRQWYQRIKKRRGTKIARVAVMRRLTVIFWHLLRHQQPYHLAAAAKPKPSPRSAKPAAKSDTQTPSKSLSQAESKVARQSASPAPALGALPPNPRDLSPAAPFEGPVAGREARPAQAAPRTKTGRRPKPPALRTEPGSGARVASRQSPILPPG